MTGHDRNEREALLRVDGRITDCDTRPNAARLLTNGWIEFNQDHRTSINRHAESRTGWQVGRRTGWRLLLPHPVTREPLALEAPLPQDFSRISC